MANFSIPGRYDYPPLSSPAPASKKAGSLTLVRSNRTGSEQALRTIIRTRAERGKFLPGHLFADPAWDMLVELYLSDILSQRISVSSLCCASNVPATTALRWIKTLQDEGLIQRTGDPCDHRRYFMSLSENGRVAMDGYFENVAAIRC